MPKKQSETIKREDLLKWIEDSIGPARTGGLSGVQVLNDLKEYIGMDVADEPEEA